MRSRLLLTTAAAILAACAATALTANPAVAGAPDAGTVSGIVRYAGKTAVRARIEITKDKEVCGAKQHFDESLIVSPAGGIKNVVVVVMGAPGAAKPVAATFDQKDCDYVPHVLALPVGSTVEILNSDGILHSVHALRGEKTLFDKAQPGFKKKITATVQEPGAIRILCDAHGWMEGWWYVTATRYYAVTDAAGKFTIKDVPTGTYTLQAWQEKLGTREQKIEVKPGAAATADFTYQPR
jgi:plastocyanin